MSGYNGGGFEEWLRSSIAPISNRAWNELLMLLEPYREIVDYYCAVYDPSAQNWIEYRNMLWLGIPEDVRERVNEIVNESVFVDEREN